MSPKKARNNSALLSALEPTLTLSVQLGAFRSRRNLQLRGPVIVLSKSALPDPQSDKLLVLSESSNISSISSTQLSVAGQKITFASSNAAQLFLRSANAAIKQAANGASKYFKVVEIGNGATGVVYLVRRKHDNKLFALKTVNKVDVFLSTSHLSNLIRERIALAEFADSNSPFVIRLVDAFETEKHLNFVTELGEFGDLRQVLKQIEGNRFSEDVARRMFAEIVMGVEQIHRRGYLYRDLKLANLLVTKTGHVKVADLGLVKRLAVEQVSSSVSSDSEGDDEEEFRLIGQTNSFVGTRRYMSPEHVNGLRRKSGYGAPADIWALGVTLFVMLTGNFPFGRDVESRNTAEMFYAISKEEILYPEYLSEESVGMLKGLLERDVYERFDLREIKNHAWMKDMDWGEIRHSAVVDEEVEEVVKALKDGGVKSLDESMSKVLQREEEISSVSEESLGRRKKEKNGSVGYALVGFGYSSSF